jgi:hypothetical protein
MPPGIEDPHGSLRTLVAELGETQDLRRAGDLLAALQAELGPHFREEERAGGLFDTLSAAAYGQERAVEELRHEHVLLAAEVEATLAQVRATLRGPVGAVLRRAALLAERIRAHERKESTAWLGAIYAESGGSE